MVVEDTVNSSTGATFVLPGTQTAPISKSSLWAGRIVSALPILFLLFDSVVKLVLINPVSESVDQLGFPVSLVRGIAILELVSLILYIIPRTSILGAILLTGFLGGAVAAHVRVENPLFTHTFFPVYVGALIWLGLYLRDEQLRKLVPMRR
jgi:hypothetical protein